MSEFYTKCIEDRLALLHVNPGGSLNAEEGFYLNKVIFFLDYFATSFIQYS